MLLAVDVGNTNIMIGVFNDQKVVTCWRLATDWNSTEDELGITVKSLLHHSRLSSRDITAVAISSVVPPLMYSLERMAEKYFSVKPLVIRPDTQTGMKILLDNPRELGADRMVNALAGYTLYGGPLIIVDFGTATTFCAISKEGHYMGGAIAPGLGISVEALFEKAAKLPRVELIRPPAVIGKSTIASLQSGIVYGFVGQVDGIVRRMAKEFSAPPLVVATGGFASLIAQESETIARVNPLLTLEGLQIIYRQQQEKTRLSNKIPKR
ncbi:MAG: type III pantothenate kinase [Dethiobacteria bacterium]|nr:type III pantothenate kinase [Bacillota bacterium]